VDKPEQLLHQSHKLLILFNKNKMLKNKAQHCVGIPTYPAPA
jgi:hypothetical protein